MSLHQYGTRMYPTMSSRGRTRARAVHLRLPGHAQAEDVRRASWHGKPVLLHERVVVFVTAWEMTVSLVWFLDEGCSHAFVTLRESTGG